MKSINFKKAILITVSVTLLLICCTAGLVITVDPFFQYHKPLSSLNYLIDNQLSQNPGMIRHFDYDSVILGSSMTVNFDTNLFQETMGLNTLKLSTNAAYPKDIDIMLSQIRKQHENINTVFLGIDPSTYFAEPEITAYPYPSYLYDNNIFNDVYYLFNKDIILNYIIKPQIQKTNTKVNEIYWSWPYMQYGKEAIERSYAAPEFTGRNVPRDTYLKPTEYNMEHYILPHIREMKDTKFVIFFPPYSILYWYNRAAEGNIEAYMEEITEITGLLLECPNVRVFTFQDDFEYITDFDNYCDYTHYNHDMNDYMTRCFADGSCELTRKNYRSRLNKMEVRLLNYDYENCW